MVMMFLDVPITSVSPLSVSARMSKPLAPSVSGLGASLQNPEGSRYAFSRSLCALTLAVPALPAPVPLERVAADVPGAAPAARPLPD